MSNFVTVEEARRKTCPIFAILPVTLRPDPRCGADNCMMWRWDPLPYYEGDSDHPTPRGYCGLAGFPQREGLP